jgi:hypothetical protein
MYCLLNVVSFDNNLKLVSQLVGCVPLVELDGRLSGIGGLKNNNAFSHTKTFLHCKHKLLTNAVI